MVFGWAASNIPVFGRHSALRKWLQSLTTGEAGFMNVCVGSSAFAFALLRHNTERRETLEANAKVEFDREYDTVLDRINSTKPEVLLDAMSWYRRTLVSEATKAGVRDPTRAELSDEWVRRKRSPQDDLVLGTHNVPDAMVINEHRLQLKRMWHSVRDLYCEYEHLEVKSEPSPSQAPRVDGGKQCYKFERHEINDDLRDDIARGTLLHLEPLDHALCRNTPGCEWPRDADPIYAFIRERWGIAASWPAEEQLFEPLEGDGPNTRIATAMAALAKVRAVEPRKA